MKLFFNKSIGTPFKFISILMLIIGVVSFSKITAQESANKVYPKQVTIEEQFNHVIEKSSKWENYKMVTDTWLTSLRRNTLDSINLLKTTIAEKNTIITQKDTTIKKLEANLEATNHSLLKATKEKNSFSIIGIVISKPLFLTLTWTIIIALSVISFVAISFYKGSHFLIKKTREEHAKALQDFDDYRQDSRKKYEQLVVQHHKEMQKLKGH